MQTGYTISGLDGTSFGLHFLAYVPDRFPVMPDGHANADAAKAQDDTDCS